MEEPKTAQIVIPQSNVKDVLAQLHGGSMGGHTGINTTLDKDTVVLLCEMCMAGKVTLYNSS